VPSSPAVTIQLSSELKTAPAVPSRHVIDGLVYFSNFAQRTYALRATNGTQVATFADGKYSPAVADRARLYFVGLGKLYALAPRR